MCVAKPDSDPTLPKVFVMALTGKAACNVDGNTIHGTMDFNPNQNLEEQNLGADRLDTVISQHKQLDMIVIDEVSLTGQRLIGACERRLRATKRKPTDAWGEVDVLLAGDFFQLKSISDTPLYRKIAPEHQLGLQARAFDAWRRFSLYELSECMRQKDPKWIDILNRVRIGKQTAADIATINTRVAKKWPVDRNIPLIAYRRDVCAKHNAEVLGQLPGAEITLTAIDRMSVNVPAGVKAKKDVKDCGGLFEILHLKDGMLIEVLMNIDTQDYLSNGTDGLFRAVRKDAVGNVAHVWIEFPSDNIGRRARLATKQLYPLSTPTNWRALARHTREFYLCGNEAFRMSQTQFPIGLEAARTIHITSSLVQLFLWL